MKKLQEFTKLERIIALVSVIWIILMFVIAINESDGHFDQSFFEMFCIFGIIPVLLFVGVKWVKSASKS